MGGDHFFRKNEKGKGVAVAAGGSREEARDILCESAHVLVQTPKKRERMVATNRN